MKYSKLYSLGVFILSNIIWIGIFRTTSGYCSGINHFGHNSLTSQKAFLVIAFWIIPLVLGITIYKKAIQKLNVKNIPLFLIIYIFSITTISRLPRIIKIPKSFQNKEFYSGLCNKSFGFGNGMEHGFHNLTFTEYTFLKSNNGWPKFPDLDSSAVNITAYYYKGDISSDFLFTIKAYTKHIPIDTANWEILKDSLEFKHIRHEQEYH